MTDYRPHTDLTHFLLYHYLFICIIITHSSLFFFHVLMFRFSASTILLSLNFHLHHLPYPYTQSNQAAALRAVRYEGVLISP